MFRLLLISFVAIFLLSLFSCTSSSFDEKKEEEQDNLGEKETKKEVTLLYPGLDQKLHPLNVFIEKKENKTAQLESILVEYLKIKPSNDLVNPFPENSQLRAVYILRDDCAVVDLSSLTAEVGGVEEETFRVFGIVNTLNYNFPEIKKVKILVEGLERETFMGHIDLSNSIPPEKSLNGKEIQ